jgi:hypothetical protein
MEGVTASLIILGVLLFIIEANSLVVPQTSEVIGMKLGLLSNDALTCLDWNANNTWSTTGSLTTYVANWNGQTVSYNNNMPDPELTPLNANISTMLPQDIRYNIEFFYINGTGSNSDMVLINGEPGDNSVVSTRLVTLNMNDTDLSPFWREYGIFPQVVQVKMISWYI